MEAVQTPDAPSAQNTEVAESTLAKDQQNGSEESASASSKSNATEKNDAKKAMAAVAKRLLKVKIDNTEKELPEDEVVQGYQMRQASDKRFQEAHKMRKDAENLLRGLADPEVTWEILKKLGHDPDKLAEARLMKRLELERMSPEQREAFMAKQELEQMRQEQRQREEFEQQAKIDELTKHYETDFEQQAITALQKTGLPASPYAVLQMAWYVQKAMERGVDLTFEEVAPFVKKDMQRAWTHMFSASKNGKEIFDFLGEETVSKIRAYDLERHTNGGGTPPQVPAGNAGAGSSGTRSPKPLTMQEWKERNRRIVNG